MRRAAFTLAALALSTASHGADLMPTPIYSSPAAPAGLDTGGWYLRGDVGYVLPMRPKVDGVLPAGLTRTFENERFGKSMMLGAGVGYKFNNWLRADITAEWRKEYDFKATNSGTAYVQGFSDERARFSARTYMLNGYIDLGTWSGLSPYIGAGIGVSTKDIRNWTTEVVCFTALCTPSARSATLPNTSKNGMSWALMAGTAIQVTDALAFDLGYRFLNLGGATTKTDAFGVSAKVADVKVNEVRLGLRYMFR